MCVLRLSRNCNLFVIVNRSDGHCCVVFCVTGETPLHHASREGDKEVAELLRCYDRQAEVARRAEEARQAEAARRAKEARDVVLLSLPQKRQLGMSHRVQVRQIRSTKHYRQGQESSCCCHRSR